MPAIKPTPAAIIIRRAALRQLRKRRQILANIGANIMPKATITPQRDLPHAMRRAIAEFIGPIPRYKPGQRALPVAVSSNAERGATLDDTRAAIYGLITQATPHSA